MILINQLKLKPGFIVDDVKRKALAVLKIHPDDLLEINIVKQSVDARKKQDICYVLAVSCVVKNETLVLKKLDNPNVSLYTPIDYSYSITGNKKMNKRPVVVGAGPCGLFAALYLAENGYKPIVLERGFDVDSRTKDVEEFWNGGKLNVGSNVLFGEGGAGTFSDGKLNTLVKDKSGRNKEVLKRFVEFGASDNILYDAKPHVGTDVLKTVVKNIRNHIVNLGGEFRFNACVTDICIDDNKITKIIVNGINEIDTDIVILAIGHSARDTFKMLYDKKIQMEQKDFAVGFRIEHKQDMINRALYCDDEEILEMLPPASYKLTYKADNGRGVYSFCMCPGGYVVNASSENGMLCVNGMSYKDRNGENANSAIVVNVSRKDFNSDSPLAGIEFQREIEKKAFEAGNGSVAVERLGDFKAGVLETLNLENASFSNTDKPNPQIKGSYSYSDISNVLPKELNETLLEGIDYFERIIPGFSNSDSLLSAVESRTSSPVRIVRDDNFESLSAKGLYPCGEGAGYAGGITSAAMDGMKVFEKIISIYKPF